MRYLRTIDENGCQICSRCRESKPVEEFSKDKTTTTGFSYDCKVCHREVVKESYEKHKAKILARKAARINSTRERVRAEGRRYYLRNKEIILAKAKIRQKNLIQGAGRSVQTAVRRGELPKVSDMYCFRCQRPAQQYHHQSYAKADHLCVVPVCRSCHHALNRLRPNGANDLGIIPTHYGLVRIAIATVPE